MLNVLNPHQTSVLQVTFDKGIHWKNDTIINSGNVFLALKKCKENGKRKRKQYRIVSGNQVIVH